MLVMENVYETTPLHSLLATIASVLEEAGLHWWENMQIQLELLKNEKEDYHNDMVFNNL